MLKGIKSSGSSISLNQSYTFRALHPDVPQVPLLLHPAGEHPPPDLVPQDEHPIYLFKSKAVMTPKG
jgi:hypothetical protein